VARGVIRKREGRPSNIGKVSNTGRGETMDTPVTVPRSEGAKLPVDDQRAKNCLIEGIPGEGMFRGGLEESMQCRLVECYRPARVRDGFQGRTATRGDCAMSDLECSRKGSAYGQRRLRKKKLRAGAEGETLRGWAFQEDSASKRHSRTDRRTRVPSDHSKGCR